MAAATYASLNYMTGGANHQWHDGTWSFTGSLHRSHNFGIFQAYYGANGTLGAYKVQPYRTGGTTVNAPLVDRYAFDDSTINARSGKKFFGAWGLAGSINIVVPFGKRSEWRMIGTELSWNHEFGKYLDFRKKLPAGAANIVDRNSNFFTFSIFTEVVGRLNNGNSLGYKMAFTRSTQKLRPEPGNLNLAEDDLIPTYFSQTIHLGIDRATFYTQVNLGTYTGNFQTGINLRIGK